MGCDWQHQYLALAVSQCCDVLWTVSSCGQEPYWPRRVFAMALKPWSRSAILRDSKRGIRTSTSPSPLEVAVLILHVGERKRWTVGEGELDAHIRRRIQFGTLCQ
jgi:hypothetical protein